VTARPTLEEIQAAARILDEAGRFYGWWKGKSYDEIAAIDPIGKSEFDGLVERMLIAAADVKRGQSPISEGTTT
jgi:hypothetical protein